MTETHEGQEIATIPQNEPSRPPEAGNEAGLLSKIQSAASKAYQGASAAIKRGRGRPPGAKNKPKDGQDIIFEDNGEPENDNPQAPALAATPEAVPVLSPAIVSRCVGSIVRGIFAIPHYFAGLALRKKGRTEAEAERLADKAGATQQEIDDLAVIGGLLIKKYQVESQYSLEFGAGLILTSIGMRYGAIFLEARKHADVAGTNLIHPKEFEK